MFLEGLSNVRARIGKFALYVSTILRHGFDTQAAHMAVSGIADQEKTQTAERQARQQAMEALEAD